MNSPSHKRGFHSCSSASRAGSSGFMVSGRNPILVTSSRGQYRMRPVSPSQPPLDLPSGQRVTCVEPVPVSATDQSSRTPPVTPTRSTVSSPPFHPSLIPVSSVEQDAPTPGQGDPPQGVSPPNSLLSPEERMFTHWSVI